MTNFQHPGDAATCAARVARNVPALHDLHLLAGLLLAEHVPETGHVLVPGAGGGLERRALAERHPGWQFTGVDPSAPMLDQACATMGDMAGKARFIEGDIDDAPDGPFDGAISLLSLNFLTCRERPRTLQQLVRRLRPGAPLVAAHHSFPTDDGQVALWLRRRADFLVARRAPADQAEQGIETIKTRLPVLPPKRTRPSWPRPASARPGSSSRPSPSRDGSRRGSDRADLPGSVRHAPQAGRGGFGDGAARCPAGSRRAAHQAAKRAARRATMPSLRAWPARA